MNRTTYISPYEAERRARRSGGWKFWIIAILVHLLLIVGATHFVIHYLNPPSGLRSRNFGVEVAAPWLRPDGLGFFGKNRDAAPRAYRAFALESVRLSKS